MSATDAAGWAFAAMTLIGTVAFAASGVLAAARAGMDWLGATVLALVVAVGGGTLRDVVIGNTPVSWVVDPWPLAAAAATALAGLAALRLRPPTDLVVRWPYLVADAIGLAAFVVVGTTVCLERGLPGPVAAILGVITGVGGGVLRDLLTATTPMVLVGQIYAVAGLVGAALLVLLTPTDLPAGLAIWLSMAVIVVIRLVAVARDWHLPAAAGPHR